MGVETEYRHNFILDEVKTKGKVYVKEIAQKLNVTEVTIRRDLVKLQKNGLVKKTYGGAVTPSPQFVPSVRFRQTKRAAAKRVIGKLASQFIEDGDIIYLEAGSTCNEIIPFLDSKKNLTVIVNSLYLMRRLGESTGHKVIVVGGEYRPDRMDMVGPGAEAAINQLSGFKAFTGADDISIEAGISGADVVTVTFTKLVLKKASQVIFVGDSAKFDNPSLYKIADIDRINYIVTNTKPSNQWIIAAKEKNIRLVYPSSN